MGIRVKRQKGLLHINDNMEKPGWKSEVVASLIKGIDEKETTSRIPEFSEKKQFFGLRVP